jgi:hypothetical protein
MSNPAEELALEQMAARLGIPVTQLKMRMVMQGPGGRDVMRDIVEDNIPSLRRLREGQQGPKPKEPEEPKPRGSGWAPERPLGPLPERQRLITCWTSQKPGTGGSWRSD